MSDHYDELAQAYMILSEKYAALQAEVDELRKHLWNGTIPLEEIAKAAK